MTDNDQSSCLVPRIRKLPDDVVSRIAAGEVLQRPVNAIKEMIENSIDAGSTNISIYVEKGGSKLLQLQDDGHGIQKEDLTVLCERFTTSKIKTYDDLKSISTFGFRGEALASISHVARMTVTSKTADSPCAFRARYQDGKILEGPTPCAAKIGTVIVVEDLFYNLPARKRALKTGAEAYHKILELVTAYGIHFGDRGVAFNCRKDGNSIVDLSIPADSSVLNNIILLYGNPLGTELRPIKLAHNEHLLFDPSNEELCFSLTGYISNNNYHSRRSTFLLFINNRLVQSSAIRKAVEGVYNEFLPRNAYPFVYMSFMFPTFHLDVNIHPTKQEVSFLHEDKVIRKVQDGVKALLEESNQSRTFSIQTRLTGTSTSNRRREVEEDSYHDDENDDNEDEEDFDNPIASMRPKNRRKRVYAHQMVRTDSSNMKMDDFLASPPSTIVRIDHDPDKSSSCCGDGHEEDDRNPENPIIYDVDDEMNTMEGQTKDRLKTLSRKRPRTFQETTFEFDSITELLTLIRKRRDDMITEIMTKHTLVGLASRQLCLMQHLTKLYLVNVQKLSHEMFYQLTIRQFGCMGRIRLQAEGEDISLLRLLRTALDLDEAGWTEDEGDKDELAESMAQLFIEKAKMLDEYFRINIRPDGVLLSLPELLEGYKPVAESFPMMFFRMATMIDWNLEKECFDGIAQELARAYSVLPRDASYEFTVKQMILPSFRWALIPSATSREESVKEVACLTQLYKVFERC